MADYFWLSGLEPDRSSSQPGRPGMRWQLYTLCEAATKTASTVLQKLAGVAIENPATALLYSGIIGIVQIFAGFSLRRGGTRLIFTRKDVALSIACGVFASIANVLGPVAYLYGADLAGRTFIVTMSVIPGMFVGQFLFSQALSVRQYLSIGIFLIGAWAILDGPNLYTLVTNPPIWVWVTLIVALTGAVSEALRNGMSKEYSPMSNNFWVGVSTLVGSAGLFALMLAYVPGVTFADVNQVFILASVATGAIVVVMISMSLLAYQEGAYIALKKVLMNSVYLVGAALAGGLFFGEPLTALRWSGMALFALAVFLSDTRAWEFVSSRLSTRSS